MAIFRTFCYNPSPNPAIPGTEQVTAAECKAIVDKYTQRIKEALSY